MLESSYYPINIFFITINIEMIIYIYHNFATIKIVSTFFNIIYALFFTLILYRIINTIASIRLEDINIVGKKIKNEMINVALKIINFLILIMGILLVMHFAGANLATVLSGLGIGGFAIAFAARESLANFLGTISILMSDIFSQGDWIVVNNSEGTVVEIGLRVTTLRTFDNALIAIPNGTIANNDVKNWSRRTLGRRIKLSLGIKYDSKPVDIRNAITQIRQMLQEHNGIATTKTNYTYEKHKRTKLVSQEDSVGVKRTLLVYLDTLSDSSITILVYCFTKTIDWNQWLETKEDVIYKIMDILETNHLEFAYPSLSIYHENDSIQA
jgi:MscS family membrane protein